MESAIHVAAQYMLDPVEWSGGRSDRPSVRNDFVSVLKGQLISLSAFQAPDRPVGRTPRHVPRLGEAHERG